MHMALDNLKNLFQEVTSPLAADVIGKWDGDDGAHNGRENNEIYVGIAVVNY